MHNVSLQCSVLGSCPCEMLLFVCVCRESLWWTFIVFEISLPLSLPVSPWSGSGKDFQRVSFQCCSGRWLGCRLDLFGFLSKCCATNGHECCSEHVSRVCPVSVSATYSTNESRSPSLQYWVLLFSLSASPWTVLTRLWTHSPLWSSFWITTTPAWWRMLAWLSVVHPSPYCLLGFACCFATPSRLQLYTIMVHKSTFQADRFSEVRIVNVFMFRPFCASRLLFSFVWACKFTCVFVCIFGIIFVFLFCVLVFCLGILVSVVCISWLWNICLERGQVGVFVCYSRFAFLCYSWLFLFLAVGVYDVYMVYPCVHTWIEHSIGHYFSCRHWLWVKSSSGAGFEEGRECECTVGVKYVTGFCFGGGGLQLDPTLGRDHLKKAATSNLALSLFRTCSSDTDLSSSISMSTQAAVLQLLAKLTFLEHSYALDLLRAGAGKALARIISRSSVGGSPQVSEAGGPLVSAKYLRMWCSCSPLENQWIVCMF